MEWDVAIVGAGPAGATAAIAARHADPHARVLLLDAAQFPRDKVCGDGIAPHALDVLAGLGVEIARLVAGTQPITSLRLVSPGGGEAVREFARPAHVVPRAVFDARLVEAAIAAGAVMRHERVRSITAVNGGVEINGQIGARLVIGADGAESVVRGTSGFRAPPAGTVAIALRGYAPVGSRPRGQQLLTMTKAHWPAYAWAFPVGNGSMNVGYGELLRDEAASRVQLTERLHRLLPGVDVARLHGHRLPLSTGRPVFARDRVLLAGDAASLINPLTGEGIYYAVLSGSLAGAASVGLDPVPTYRASMSRVLGRHLRHTDFLARLTRQPALLDLGTTAARDSQAAFDRLVEIGLGAGTLDVRLALAMLRSAARR